jgi:membrane associated rhomboid family serine protease
MFGGEVLLLLILFGLALLVIAASAPMIPVRRRRHASDTFPVVTIGLLVLNLLLFLGTSHGGFLDQDVARGWGLTPRDSSVITLLTSVFLHGSWLHLGGNLLGLWLFGPHVEEALGRLEYLLFYLGCGVAAGLLHVVVAVTFLPAAAAVPMIGASGAIFGVLGLFAVRFYRARVRVFLVAQIPAVWAVCLFATLQVVNGVAAVRDGGRSDATANWAHVGGFVFGMLLAVPLRMREDGKREYRLEDAEIAVAEGRLDQAAAFYRLALVEKPDDAASHRALARVCARLRQGEAAHRHFLDALRLYLRSNESPSVASLYDEACHSFETFSLPPTLLQRVASACEEAYQFPLAQRALSELCRDHPDAREAELALLRLGKIHLQKLNQPQNAAGIFAEFLRLYPHSEWHDHAERLLHEAQRDTRNVGGSGGPPLPATPG